MKYLITIQEVENPNNKHEKVWNIEDGEDSPEVGRKVIDILATINENKDIEPFEEDGCEKCGDSHVDKDTGMCDNCSKSSFK